MKQKHAKFKLKLGFRLKWTFL